jgi:hypothetical protein
MRSEIDLKPEAWAHIGSKRLAGRRMAGAWQWRKEGNLIEMKE